MTYMRTLLATTLVVAMASPSLAADLPKTTVNVVGNLGITTQSRELEAPFWNTEVREKSGGAITANFRPWNEMGLKGSEVFTLLSQGVMNIATAQLGHHSGADPINDGTDLAGLSSSLAEFRKVSDAFFPMLAGYYREKLGLELLSLQSFQDQILYCRAPISGIADLKERRIRASGASQADFVGYFGATAIDIPFGEVQPAMEQGVIDCAITGSLGGYTARWYETAKYLYTLPVNFGASATVANAAWWDGLDPAVQEFLRTEITQLSERMWALNAEEDQVGKLCNTTGPCDLGEPAGMTLVEPSEQDAELRAKALVEVVLPGWVKRCGDICKTSFNEHLATLTGHTIN